MSTPVTQSGPAPTSAASTAKKSTSWIRIAAPLATGLLFGLMPAPAGLAPNAWHFFALFAAVVVALVTEPIPVGLVGFLYATSWLLLLGAECSAYRWQRAVTPASQTVP